jgi:hypothetical protein
VENVATALQESLWTVRLPLPAVTGASKVVTLWLALFPGMRGGKCLVPDPRTGCPAVGGEIRKAFVSAWEFAAPHLPARSWVRWSLTPSCQDFGSVEWESASGVITAGLIGLARGLNFERVGMSAAVTPEGKLRPTLAEVEGADAAYRAGIRRRVLARRGVTAEQELSGRFCQWQELEVVFAGSVEEAIPHLKRQHR